MFGRVEQARGFGRVQKLEEITKDNVCPNKNSKKNLITSKIENQCCSCRCPIWSQAQKKENVEREHGRKKNTVEKRKTQKNKY